MILSHSIIIIGHKIIEGHGRSVEVSNFNDGFYPVFKVKFQEDYMECGLKVCTLFSNMEQIPLILLQTIEEL